MAKMLTSAAIVASRGLRFVHRAARAGIESGRAWMGR